MATIVKMVVIAFGVLNFLLGFAPYAEFEIGPIDGLNFFEAGGAGVAGLSLLLLGALVTAFTLLPKQDSSDATVAAASLAGFLLVLFAMFSLGDGSSIGVGLILVLIVSFLQAAAAVVALLVTAEIIKPRSPSPYGGYYPQAGYGQPGQPGGYGGQQGMPGQAPPQQQNYGGPPQGPGYGQGYQQH